MGFALRRSASPPARPPIREKAFDLCAVCGDFVPRPEGWSTAGETEEKLSAEEGEMSATLGESFCSASTLEVLAYIHTSQRR